MHKVLYLQHLSESKKYQACPHKEWVDVEIEVIDLVNEKVHFSFQNRPENGGGTSRYYFNQIECNRYMREINPSVTTD